MRCKLKASALVALIVILILASSAAAHSEYFILKGDLHVHSSFSHDSNVPVEQVVAESRIAGYDFIALTEHNTTRHLMQDHSTDDLLVIAGYEHTITQIAHVNIFGLRNIPKKTAIYTQAEMAEYLEPLKERGALIQLNHPNDPTYYSRIGYNLDVHFIEVLNGVWREDDHKTLQDWHNLLVEGHKIVATAGTDAHKNHTVRRAFNNVYVTERSEEAILEGLMAGRNYITTAADAPEIFMAVGDVITGGTAKYEEGQAITVQIKNIAPATIVRLYSDRGLELEDTFSGSRPGYYEVEMGTAGKRFIRAELWFDDTTICAFTNPVYIEY